LKLGLLADIHGNHYALKAVLDSAKKKGIEKLLVTGDFIGYYFWPMEVLELLKDWDVVAIRGNHDRMLGDILNNNPLRLKLYKKYGSGLNIAFEKLDKKSIDWLLGLSDTAEYDTPEGKILLCHGSPWDPDEYVYPNSSNTSLERYKSLDVKWVIQGHTHYPMNLIIGNTSLINPGSVGQPRNSQPGAHWTSLNTVSGEVRHFCEKYEIALVEEESKKRHPELPYLSQILERK